MGFIRRHTLEERAFATIGGGLLLLEFYCRFYSVELGTVYTDAVSFVTASVSKRLHLSFTRHWSSSFSEPGRSENAFKSGAFSKRYGLHWSCKRRNRIDLAGSRSVVFDAVSRS